MTTLSRVAYVDTTAPRPGMLSQARGSMFRDGLFRQGFGVGGAVAQPR